MAPKSDKNVVYAYEPDQTLRELIGKSTLLSDIFTKEKLESAQSRVDAARISFFTSSARDMHTIEEVMGKKSDDLEETCRELFQPVRNIKGQADVFGFSLIACICKYLTEYCDSNRKAVSTRDAFIITKLVEALRRTFQEKIVDQGGAFEQELVAVIEQAKK